MVWRDSPRIDLLLDELDGVVECDGMDCDGNACMGIFIPYERNSVGIDNRGRRVMSMRCNMRMRSHGWYMSIGDRAVGFVWYG